MMEKQNHMVEKRAAGDVAYIDDMVDATAGLMGGMGKSAKAKAKSEDSDRKGERRFNHPVG